MSQAYYVRIRGRVHGPIDRTKLDHLVARGQLSRIHEISTDGQNWQAASTMPELFVQPVAAAQPIENSGHEVPSRTISNTNSPSSPPTTTESSQPHDEPGFDLVEDSTSWYYAVGGSQLGPIPINDLANLIRTHQVSQRDLVWTNEMENWVEAGTVSSLASLFKTEHTPTNTESYGHDFTATDGGTDDVIHFELQQWSGSVGWVRNLAFFLGLLSSGKGIVGILSCLVDFSTGKLLSGLVQMVVGVLIAWTGVTLVRLKRELNATSEVRTSNAIAATLRMTTPVWRSLAVSLIAMIIGLLFLLLVEYPSGPESS